MKGEKNMLKDLTERKYKYDVEYVLCFDDGRADGFAFPCDKDGNVLDGLEPAAQETLRYCLAHPEKFARFNQVVSRVWRSIEPARGTCSCGETVVLDNPYIGACQCEKCGQWYNLFGEELLPPEQWEM